METAEIHGFGHFLALIQHRLSFARSLVDSHPHFARLRAVSADALPITDGSLQVGIESFYGDKI